jgi:hypothetical protein
MDEAGAVVTTVVFGAGAGDGAEGAYGAGAGEGDGDGDGAEGGVTCTTVPASDTQFPVPSST